MIERVHLHILYEVARHGTLTEAARALHLSQSALSHSMRKLEASLEVELWVKDGRTLRFTQAGEYLLEVAREVLPRLSNAESTLKGFSGGRRGLLRVGLECHPCYEWLLRTVRPFLDRWPDVDLDVRQRFQFGGLEALRTYDIDALVTPDPVDDVAFVFTPVLNYELMLVVPEQHALAGARWAEAKDLADEHLITYPVPRERLDIFTQFLLPNGVYPRTEQAIETTEIMLHLVAAGRGVSAIPGWLAADYATRLPLRLVRLGEAGVAKQLFVGVRREDVFVAYLADFIQRSSVLSP